MTTDDGRGWMSDTYAERIGRPRTTDEVRGYWLFVLGLVFGVLGIVAFLPSGPASGLREASVALGGIGLALLVAGPVIRLPLRRTATYTTYLGLAACLAAVVWFLVVFPANWSVETGHAGVVSLYALGLAIVGVGGVVIPLLTGSTAAIDERVADLERDAAAERERRERAESERDEAREAGEREAAAAEEERERLEAELDALRESQAQFELYEDRAGKWRWRLRHRNGNVVADGGQGYTQKHNAQKGMASVRRNALGAAVLQVDAALDATDADEADIPMIPEVAEESQATFEVYEDEGADYRWRLVHDNGNIIADSGEGYTRRRDARRAIESVRRNVGPADYLRFDPASFEVYRDRAGQWRWRLVHKNGNIVADSGEGYTRRRDARRAAERVREGAGDATVEERDEGDQRD